MKKFLTLIAVAVMALAVQAEMIDGHEYVDLGLPSGTLWATCNVGADTPEGYGGHFAWGEIEPKDVFDDNYKWEFEGKLTKYCNNSDKGYNGFTDGKTELDPEDDAAYINWGTSWRIPTNEQQLELMNNCYWERATINGVNGRLGTGPNGNSIFLPAAGVITSWSNSEGRGALYTSRNIEIDNVWSNYIIGFDSDYTLYSGTSGRSFGFPVRAVVEINETPTPAEKTDAPSSNKDNFVYNDGNIYYNAYTITLIPTEESDIYYRIGIMNEEGTYDYGQWMLYEAPFEVTEAGTYMVEAYAVAPDKAESDHIWDGFTVSQAVSVDELFAGKTVANVRYFNVAGQQMQQPSGLTIMVTTYTDGTTTAAKVMK